ncbi:MFS transporter [Nocardioides coralli]|uniref:MFS transporter n=1 Tax=Nocardioides coralli TaxID=2872154 RepID=UPI001CA40131|nr:MFS transporter [Nocardioides coralli]QZY29203.1 MFS transporter [Nocardioides coralli]
MSDPVADNVVDTIGDQATGRALPRALRPFRAPAYRRLAVSLVATTFGQGVWVVALVWEVIRLGGGPTQLSVVTTANAIGVLLPALLAGVLADRVPQKTILLGVCAVELSAISAVTLLSLTGTTELWHLTVIAFVIGSAMSFYYPAYSAWLPALVAEADLMAVNGFEGMVRPAVGQAIGPAVAGVVVGAASPGAALSIAAGSYVVGFLVLLVVPRTPVRRDLTGAAAGHPVRTALADMAEGYRYMVRTPWLLATLLFASIMVLAVIGPLEVLIPFLVKDVLDGGAGDHALVLAGFGVGSAVGSFAMGSLRMPRRYLTVMNLTWGVSCLPFLVIGAAGHIWVVVAAAVVIGAGFAAPMVIWGTLLQRRVPPALLGRVASLDFFVSLALMPVSMALAGPLAALVGLRAAFVVAGVVPVVVAVVAIWWARLPDDELAHPLRDDEPVS